MTTTPAAEVLAIVTAHADGFWRLLDGEGTAEDRRQALIDLMAAAYGKGYENGLRRRPLMTTAIAGQHDSRGVRL